MGVTDHNEMTDPKSSMVCYKSSGLLLKYSDESIVPVIRMQTYAQGPQCKPWFFVWGFPRLWSGIAAGRMALTFPDGSKTITDDLATRLQRP
jgi:hypothetical protein